MIKQAIVSLFLLTALFTFCGCSDAKNTNSELQRAVAHAERNDWQKAREISSRILKKSPKNSNAQLVMALCLENSGSLEEAADLARQAAKVRRSDFTALYTAARLTYRATPARRETFDELEKALMLRPNDLNTLILLCNCGTTISHPRVIKHLEKLAKLNPPDPAAVEFQFGACYAAQKQYNRAIRHFNTAIKLKPESAELHYAAASHLDRAGSHAAVNFYRNFITHPGSKERAMVDIANQRITYFRHRR